MSHHRRKVALTILGLVGTTLTISPSPLWAKPPPEDDDDAPPNVFISPHGQPFRAREEFSWCVALVER